MKPPQMKNRRAKLYRLARRMETTALHRAWVRACAGSDWRMVLSSELNARRYVAPAGATPFHPED